MTILCENQGRPGTLNRHFSGQHDLSIFIEADEVILLDVGPSPIVLENARLAGVDLHRIDWIVLSHGHWDHADGLLPMTEDGIRKKLICHPGVFIDRRKSSGDFIGMALGRDRVAELFALVESRGPQPLGEIGWFLGEIPRTNVFEARQTPFYAIQDGRP